jgi:hypothetical protein
MQMCVSCVVPEVCLHDEVEIEKNQLLSQDGDHLWPMKLTPLLSSSTLSDKYLKVLQEQMRANQLRKRSLVHICVGSG